MPKMERIVFDVHEDIKKKLDELVEKNHEFSSNSAYMRHLLINSLKDG